MPPDTPQRRSAHLLSLRNPGWEIFHVPEEQVYRAWRIENGRPAPPCLSDSDPTRLETRIRQPQDEALTGRLRDAIYDMRDRGMLPLWRPGPDTW